MPKKTKTTSADERNAQRVADFLTAPMVLHAGGGWESDIPTWIRDALPAARLAYLKAGGDPELACELDAAVYLMTASLCMPLSSDWTRNIAAYGRSARCSRSAARCSSRSSRT